MASNAELRSSKTNRVTSCLSMFRSNSLITFDTQLKTAQRPLEIKLIWQRAPSSVHTFYSLLPRCQFNARATCRADGIMHVQHAEGV